MSRSSTIPVHVLTGFLGSGKTTLLNGLLQSGFGAETAVIVNEFGDVGLDQLFIQSSCEEVIVLKSGCVCCTIRTDLVSTLMQLADLRHGSSEPFKRIVIETSGLSDPLPILQTLRSDINLLNRFSVGAVICTVDASHPHRVPHTREALAQVSSADAVVITKRDVVDVPTAYAARTTVTTLNPLVEILVNSGRDLVEWLERHEAQSDHSERTQHLLSLPLKPAAGRRDTHGMQSVVLRGVAPASWSRFVVWLTSLIFVHGDRILRTKGILFDPSRKAWIGVHGVRRFFHPPVHLSLRDPPNFGSCLVFITEGLDPSRIERSYHRLVEGDATGSDAYRARPVVGHAIMAS